MTSPLLPLFGVFVFCALLLTFARGPLGSLSVRAISPVLALRDRVFRGETDTLRVELASTSALIADRNELYGENQELKARLGRVESSQTLLAGVLVYPPTIPYDTLVIDAGTAQGVAPGDLVSAGGTTRIGTVRMVYGTTARVVLFSAPGETYDALLIASSTTRTSVPIVVDGQGGGSMTAQVPTGILVSLGDSVVFPGVEGGYAASVVAVSSRDGESFKTIYLRLPADPFSLRFVEILKNSHAR